MKKIYIEYFLLFSNSMAIPAIIKYTLTDFWTANSNTVLAIIGLLVASLSAYYAYLAIRDSQKSDRFDDFTKSTDRSFSVYKEYIDGDFKDFKSYVVTELNLIRTKFDYQNTELNNIKAELNGHIQLFGHSGMVELLMDTRKEIIKLATKIDQLSYENEIMTRLNKMEGLMNYNRDKLETNQEIIINKVNNINNE